MATISLEIPKKLDKISREVLIENLRAILEEYSEFDMHLLSKYILTKDLPNSRFVNL